MTALSHKQRVLWSNLSDYIRANDGFVTSEPEVPTIRFECRPDSTLPALLKSAGHEVRNVGTAERLMPTTETVRQAGNVTTMTTQGVGPVELGVWQFSIPSLDSREPKGSRLSIT